jgi:hypothetical protein
MARRFKVVLAGAGMAVALLAGGCTTIKDHRGYLVDTALVDSVLVGVDNRQSVERTLGRPTCVAIWRGDVVLRRHRHQAAAFRRPRPPPRRCCACASMPRAMWWAWIVRGMEKVVRLNPDGSHPDAGQEARFFEDLFGNIGTVGTGGGGGGAGQQHRRPNGS